MLSRWWWLFGSGAFTVVRLGFAGYMRCPVGKHWALVKFVNEADLTEQELQTLKLQPFSIHEGEKLNASIGVLVGAFSLTMSIVTHSWWLALGCVVWVMLWGAVLVHASRRPAIEQREGGAAEAEQIKSLFRRPPGQPPS